MKKKIYFVSSLTIFIAILFLYLNNSNLLYFLDKKIKDQFFIIRGKIPTTNNIVIINIDEKSISKLGQWPWSRDKIATIIQNLTNAGAGIIGLDMFFSEKDSKSPTNYTKFCKIPKKLIDTDKILATTIQNSPTILGYSFNLEKNITKNFLPNIPAIFIEKNLKKEYLLKPKGYIANIPLIQNSAYSAGFLNTTPDLDGVIRKNPLLVKYNDFIYPSLAFEMYRLAIGTNKVIINYDNNGVNNIQLSNEKIYTDRFGRIIINYRGPSYTFPYISASDIYFNKFNKKLVKNKFVLIGTSAIGLYDIRNIPFDNVFPGVEVHANIIDNLIKKDFLIIPNYTEGLTLFILLILTILIALSTYYLKSIYASLFIFILVVGDILITFYLFKYKLILIPIAPILTLIITLYIILISINYFFEEKKALQLKKAFSKKVSSEVMEELLKYSNEKLLAPKEKEITIFFSDVRNFTTISEKLGDPKKLIKLLNEYMTPMTEIIINHKGTIDKYIGDAIMAYWNAPHDVKYHADKAIHSAIKQIKELKKLKEKFKKEYEIDFDIGIGINTGIATIGEMGSEGRADYTVIGDSVNVASRIEGLNKQYKTHIIITEFTKNKLTEKYLIRELDLVRVKGKNQPIKIYEVIDFFKKDNKFEKNIKIYYNALRLYRLGEFKKALTIFENLYKENGDYIYKLYIDRCNFLIKNPLKDWNGVYTYTTK